MLPAFVLVDRVEQDDLLRRIHRELFGLNELVDQQAVVDQLLLKTKKKIEK